MNPKPTGGAKAWSWTARIAFVLLFVTTANRAFSGDAQTLPDNEAKSLCILNFTKYVDWPDGVFSDTNASVTIGCLASGEVLNDLKTAVDGKLVGGRKVKVVEAASPDDWSTCNVLFLNSADQRLVRRALRNVRGHPVLTVGEGDNFLRYGGMIDLLKKDGKVKFQIDMGAVRGGKLEISSKLLNLADNVQGKH